MKYLSLAACLIVGGLTVVSTVAQETKDEPKFEVKLISTEENLLSQEIWGKWVGHGEFSKHVGGGKGDWAFGSTTFSQDEEATRRFQQEASICVQKVKEKKAGDATIWEDCLKAVYATGKLEVQGDENETDILDFGVANLFGNQVLVVLLPDKSAGAGYRLRSFNVAFVRDPKGDNDLLWIGGDNRNEVFNCMQRSK
jgi:hypothetical protein